MEWAVRTKSRRKDEGGYILLWICELYYQRVIVSGKRGLLTSILVRLSDYTYR